MASPSGKSETRSPGRALLWVGGLIAAGLLGWISVVRVETGERVFRRTVGASAAAPLRPGLHFVIPVVQRVVRFPEGPIHISSSWKVRSPEGIELEIPFEVQAVLDDSALAKLLGAT